ncbi:DUF4157 domain-containing protein [Chitinophaga pendula]|uniref:eCIS core domain-containing protein n=1 Tax=Chitinophaga TaxID=79328 RepID=UPI000BB07039|nr:MULTISPECIES: DUF4157 domain-containing protein [Chitinophaga]ASZ10859.1 hypothetical protein CK934_07645 [Chitinophaga sp. MD30]UCJ06159.1 DUF4157 domain-containing protein [Chitinophaga pendula]
MFSQKTVTQQADEKNVIREQGNAGKSMPAVAIQKMANSSNDSAEEREEQSKPFQLRAAGPYRPNNTGLPDQLKTGIEATSGFSMDDVKVHYSSDKPAQLQALAYAQGTDIHIGPGQEKHLPHEAWHVVQQKQGRVQPTIQRKGARPINDDVGLEQEADVMGRQALSGVAQVGVLKQQSVSNPTVQGIFGITRDLLSAAVPLAGIYKGAVTGAALGSSFGMLGSLAGGAIGGVVGGVAGLVGGYGVQNALNYGRNAMFGPPSNVTGQSMPGPFDQMAYRLWKTDITEQNETIGMLSHAEKLKAEKQPLESGKVFSEHFKDQIAKPGDHQRKAAAYKNDLSEVLKSTDYIQMIFKGGLHKAAQDGSSSAGGGNLQYLPGKVPQHAEEARRMFNKLVTTKVTNVGVKRNKLDPVSAMGMNAKEEGGRLDGILHVGTVATRGVLLHELGHHLENNLSPLDFASLHNFLRARSKGDNLRKVGQGSLVGRENNETGYDTENPELGITPSKSLLKMAALSVPNAFGNEAAGNAINHFVMANSSTDESSYHSLSDRRGGTEFLSTTIHFFSTPETALKLVENDPFRVALFIMTANKAVYEEVRSKFDKKTDQHLDELIHRIG